MLFPLVISYASAATVWSDNFNDNDKEGWTVVQGILAVGSIEGASPALVGNSPSLSIAYHDSSVAYGTWSFKLYTMKGRNFRINFVCTEVPESETVDGYALGVVFKPDDTPIMKLLKIANGNEHELGEFRGGIRYSDWQTIDIVRTPEGYMYVWFGGMRRIDAQDTTYESSDYFTFCAGFTIAIDNIVVSDTIDKVIPTPPATTTTTTIATTPTQLESNESTSDQHSTQPLNSDILAIAGVSVGLIVILGAIVVSRRR